MKSGSQTSELKLVGAFGAVLALAVSYGLITEAERDMWLGLIVSLLPVAAVIMQYINSRTRIKEAAVRSDVVQVVDGNEQRREQLDARERENERESGELARMRTDLERERAEFEKRVEDWRPYRELYERTLAQAQ